MKKWVMGLAVMVLVGGAVLAAPTTTKPAAPATGAPGGDTKTRAEVEKMIEEGGKVQPEWWDSTPLNYPQTLDLAWKPLPGGGWNNQKVMGQYLWDIIDPNPSKWREGVKLVYHTLSLNKGDADATTKAQKAMARIYTEMLADYPRGAYWARKGGGMELTLVECYAKMGCRSMAIELLKTQAISPGSVKLWGDFGDLNKALAGADAIVKAGVPILGNLLAGDACRRAGDAKRAQAFYEKAIAATGGQERNPAKLKQRVQASLDAVKLFDGLDLKKIGDGTYKDASGGYVGPVTVAVKVKDHRIEEVKVVDHHEKQFYASLTEVPPQIMSKQSVKGIDMTTGATITSEAIVNAAAKALNGGQK